MKHPIIFSIFGVMILIVDGYNFYMEKNIFIKGFWAIIALIVLFLIFKEINEKPKNEPTRKL